jgi:hypothetical protein
MHNIFDLPLFFPLKYSSVCLCPSSMNHLHEECVEIFDAGSQRNAKCMNALSA